MAGNEGWSTSQSATDAYRNRVFAGVGSSFEEAMQNGLRLAHDAGYDDARVVDHRAVPRDTDWRDTDWRDTDWRDTDWVDPDPGNPNWHHLVLVHGARKS